MSIGHTIDLTKEQIENLRAFRRINVLREASLVQEWTFCTINGTYYVENGSCKLCNGDRNLIQVVPKRSNTLEQGTRDLIDAWVEKYLPKNPKSIEELVTIL